MKKVGINFVMYEFPTNVTLLINEIDAYLTCNLPFLKMKMEVNDNKSLCILNIQSNYKITLCNYIEKTSSVNKLNIVKYSVKTEKI